MFTRALAGITGLLLAAQAVASTPTPEERYDAASKRLTPCQYCLGINDTPQDIAALDAMRDAVEDSVTDQLNHGRTIEQVTTVSLNRASASANRMGALQTERLGHGLFGITTSVQDSPGTVFIVGKRHGHFEVVWDIRHFKASETSRFPMLKAWRSTAARESCRTEAGDDDGGACGPISGDIHALTPDASGRIRFAVIADYGELAGMEVGRQVSIWRWNGISAEPLLVRNYVYMLEDYSVDIQADHVTMRVKDEFHSFMSLGPTVGRQLDWTVRITPNEIVDLGMKPVIPELDLIDDVFQRLTDGRPTDGLGEPATIAQIRKLSDENDGPGEFYDSWATRDADGADICLIVDTGRLDFRVNRAKTGYFIAKMTVRPMPNHSRCRPQN